MFANSDGVAFCNPSAIAGGNANSRPEFRLTTTRSRRRSYRAATAIGSLARRRSARRVATSNSSRAAMDCSPFLAERPDAPVEHGPDVRDLPPREAVVLPEFGWASRTMQIENGFASGTEHVHMRRPMIVRIDDDSVSLKSQNGRHPNPNRLGFQPLTPPAAPVPPAGRRSARCRASARRRKARRDRPRSRGQGRSRAWSRRAGCRAVPPPPARAAWR